MSEHHRLSRRIARRYRGLWLKGYARCKLGFDPVFTAAFELLKDAPLPVLDVGCGVGLFEFYLRERGFGETLTGFDFDATKIAQAQRIAAANHAGVSFSVGHTEDALPAGAAGHVVLFDVLQYLEAGAQRELLERAAERVAPGGLCLIRAAPRDGSWRFRVTQFEESLIHALLWMKSRAIHFPSVEEVIGPFQRRGFSVEVRPLWGRTPFNSHLFVLRAGK